MNLDDVLTGPVAAGLVVLVVVVVAVLVEVLTARPLWRDDDDSGTPGSES